MKVKFIDKDGRPWEFPNVTGIDIREKDNWCDIKYYDEAGEFHDEVGDTPAEIYID